MTKEEDKLKQFEEFDADMGKGCSHWEPVGDMKTCDFAIKFIKKSGKYSFIWGPAMFKEEDVIESLIEIMEGTKFKEEFFEKLKENMENK